MKITDAKFVKSASKNTNFPDPAFPEFAFFGRSNTGKSSLMNMIMERKSLVKTGSRPGMTRLVNFFLLNNSISLVDMPGFGYAKASKAEKAKFLPQIMEYINFRKKLKLAFLLVDIRRVPGDLEKDIIVKLTENEIPIAIIATKSDKVTRNQRMGYIKKIASGFMIDPESVFLTSSKTKEGKEEIQSLIEEYSEG
jgi:GTP-binding protein